ncbi:HK97 gp10 family phage protein [Variovorax boronicumulans]|uniref:HK97 gp10 family phage protein n=1 Tax=Variovorax boronicumulans TaxID=436515 RepID=A0AAW8CLT2_9BURK|nr:HK97-gp10 family putative phage morphogenesis protein [Variovorax boronicumulans]MDP9891232.1 HK97 gp10 family phage protein [Variovorax boronicumulans]MDQ0051300.1 HK97 gp10 family phage protein [Variovorax boronicumulans]
MREISMRFDTSNCDAALDDILERARASVRPAAQAATQVVYQEVLVRVPASPKGHWFHGTSFKTTGQKYWFEPGSLRRAIYQAYSADNSTQDHATYHVSWNRKKAPYGHWVENGTSRAPAQPFLRPAYEASIDRALDAGRVKFSESYASLAKGGS